MLILIAITFFASCKNEPNNNPQCECTVKVHPYGSPCTCPVAGTPACDCSEEIRREFTITGFAKDITVIDTRTGSNDTDLETLGVIAKLTTALNAQSGNRFNTVVNRNITIVIEDVANYDGEYSKIYSGNKFGISFAYISGTAEYLADIVEDSFYFMYDDNTLDNLCTCAHTYGTTAHLGIDESGNISACTCGGTDCACTEQTAESYNVPIRKRAGVTVQQMNDTVALIKTIMDDDSYASKENFAIRGLTVIHIVSGSEVNYQNGILTVGYEAELLDVLFKFDDIYNGVA
jgi:hypothetical protein